MSDITEAATQDEIAESLMSPLEDASEAAENPAEVQEVAEGEDTTVEVEADNQEQGEEVADDWLPTEQEKVFPTEVLEKYAPRYGFTAEELQSDPRIARIVQDKLNSDIYINQLRTREQAAELAEQTEVQREPTPQQQTQPQVTHEQHFASIRKMVEQRTDPKVAQEFFAGFNKVFGVSEQDVAATLKANPNAALEFTALMSTYALNLFNTFVPDLVWSNLGPQIEQVFPQFGQMYERASYAHTWDSIRNSSPQFSQLPSYGTKEFASAARKAAESQFGSAEDFESAVFTKVVNGQRVQLSPAENNQKKYALLAQAMLGNRVDPAMVQQAVQTGKKQATRAAVKRDAGNLGSGRSKQQISQPEKDDFFADGMALYRQEHGRL